MNGLDYAITPRNIPVENIVTGAESAVRGLSQDNAESVRIETARILKMAKPSASNMTGEERSQMPKGLRRENYDFAGWQSQSYLE